MMVRNVSPKWRQFVYYTVRGVAGVAVATPIVAILQGKYYLDQFRENHREMPFPEMPCSGAVVAVTPSNDDESEQASSSSSSILASSSSWFRSLLTEQKSPQPLRLLVVGDSLAAGVGVSKSGTPVLPEAIAKTLSSALGGRAVYWTCMGEPGLSSPQIVKELLLAEQQDIDEEDDGEKQVDVMEELRGWWDKRRQLEEKEVKEEDVEIPPATPPILETPAKKVKAWWNRTRSGARRDVEELRNNIHWRDFGRSLRRRMGIAAKNLPEPAVVLPLKRRNTVVPDLVAQYDVAVVITGFNDLKNILFPLPDEWADDNGDADTKKPVDNNNNNVSPKAKEDTGSGWLEKDLWSIMKALRGKMRNYDAEERNDSLIRKQTLQSPATTTDELKGKNENDSASTPSLRRHHPMVVFPATPLFAEKIYPIQLFSAPIIKLMEYQKKKLAERYPAPVLFLEAPDDKTIKDFTNKRGPLWEARSKEEVLFELTNKARLEQLERLMKEYYDMWTVDVEEEEATLTYDVFGPDIQGPLQQLERSPLISVDRVHPSDEGYELWGRHIALAIVKEWDRRDKGKPN